MKRYCWIFFLLLLFGSPLAGQQSELGIRFGFQASPTFTWMLSSAQDINKSGNNVGVRLAVLAEYYFQENYALVSGFGFAFNQGGGLRHDLAGTYWPNTDKFPAPDTLAAGVRLRYGLQYFEIPLGLKMRTREFGYLRYYLEPNFIFGFRTQARGRIEALNVMDSEVKYDIREEVSFFNVSVGIGGGVEYALTGRTSLIAGLSAHFGFVDVVKDAEAVVINENASELRPENSKAVINGVALKFGIIF